MAVLQENLVREWLNGQLSLGTIGHWEEDEIRIISEIGYSLALYGHTPEAIVIYEGLLAVAPATAYFQASLGALYLRTGNFTKALDYLNAALEIENENVFSLVNRGEAYLLLGQTARARKDLERALRLANEEKTDNEVSSEDETALPVTRARGLLESLSGETY